MAGTVFDSQLNITRSSRVQFGVATRDDDAGIRRLLRGNPMRGAVSLSMEREPGYFADAAVPGEEKQTMVARDSGRIVCAGSCTIRTRFVNREKCRVGYLSGLRLDAGVAGRFDILRRGYRFFRELQESSPAGYYFTSIATDNRRARDFLERGIAGMPAYEFVGDFVTALIPVKRHKKTADKFCAGENSVECMEEVCAFLNEQGRNHQLVPCWSPEQLAALEPLGLKMENFRILREDGGMVACAALWDQRCFKQTVIRGYSPWLLRARPFINIAARIASTPRLPAAGSALAHAFVSHFAVVKNRPEILLQCIETVLEMAARAKLDFTTLGFGANDPRLAALTSKFHSRKYHSRIYRVRWPGMGGSACDLDGRVLCPEVALL